MGRGGKVKVCPEPMWLIRSVFLYVGLKRLRIFLFPRTMWTACKSIAVYSPTLPGSHLHSWVERSHYDKVPCSMKEVSRMTKPGLKSTLPKTVWPQHSTLLVGEQKPHLKWGGKGRRGGQFGNSPLGNQFWGLQAIFTKT